VYHPDLRLRCRARRLRRCPRGADLLRQSDHGCQSDHRRLRRRGDRRHGFDPRLDRDRIRPRSERGADQGVLPRGCLDRDLRHHGRSAADQAPWTFREGGLMQSSLSDPVPLESLREAGIPAPQRGLFIGLAAVVLLAPFLVYPIFAMKVLCFALFASAFNLLLGYVGLLSFGHAAFFGMASYVTGYTVKFWGIGPEIAIILGALSAAGLGLVFGGLAIRRQGIY